MNNLDLTLEIDRKKEYTNQVVSVLNIRIYEGIQSIYTESKKLCKKRGSRKYLKQFQNLISNIPKWTKSQIETEFNIPQISTGDLLRAETASGSELGEDLKKIMSSGKFVSDDIVLKLVSKKITSPALPVIAVKFPSRNFSSTVFNFFFI